MAKEGASLRNVEGELMNSESLSLCSHHTAILQPYFRFRKQNPAHVPLRKDPVNIDSLAFLPYISAPLCLFGYSRDASNRYLTLRPLF